MDFDISFGEWLNGRIKYTGMNIYNLAKDIDISRVAIYNHCHGASVPSVTSLQLYSKYFNEDYEYLYDLAMKDSFSVLEGVTPVGMFGKWLFDRIMGCGLPVSEVAKRLKVSRRTLYNHIEERFRPSFDMIKRYCLFFEWDDFFEVYEMTLEDWRK